MSNMQRRLRGFTLIEVLTVVAVIAILGSIALVAYQSYVAKARATDILLQYDALRTETLSKLSQSSIESCDRLASALSNSAPVSSEHVALGYGFEAVSGGFRPVLTVCAAADSTHPLAVKVARSAHDTLARAGDVVSHGAVLLPSLVSFALRLTDGDRAICKTAAKPIASDCRVGTPSGIAATAAVSAPTVPCAAGEVRASNGDCVLPPPAGQAPALASSPATPTPAVVQAPSLAAPGTPGLKVADAASLGAAPPPLTVAAPLQCYLVSVSTGRQPAQGTVIPTWQGSSSPPYRYDPNDALPEKTMGSECVVCGDHNKGTPCSDLDLILAITANCPDDKPYCENRSVRTATGQIEEYRRCVAKSTVMTQSVAQQASSANCEAGTFGTERQAAGSTCNVYCAGDLCNSDSYPSDGFRVECR